MFMQEYHFQLCWMSGLLEDDLLLKKSTSYPLASWFQKKPYKVILLEKRHQESPVPKSIIDD